MNLIVQLVIAVVIGAAATAAALSIETSPLTLGAIVTGATLLTVIITNLGGGSAATSNSVGAASTASSDSAAREEGEVKWFNGSKGFGFIIRPNGDEIFVHFRSIRGDGNTRRSLRDGQRVSYELGQSDKGPQAEEVEGL